MVSNSWHKSDHSKFRKYWNFKKFLFRFDLSRQVFRHCSFFKIHQNNQYTAINGTLRSEKRSSLIHRFKTALSFTWMNLSHCTNRGSQIDSKVAKIAFKTSLPCTYRWVEFLSLHCSSTSIGSATCFRREQQHHCIALVVIRSSFWGGSWPKLAGEFQHLVILQICKGLRKHYLTALRHEMKKVVTLSNHGTSGPYSVCRRTT